MKIGSRIKTFQHPPSIISGNRASLWINYSFTILYVLLLLLPVFYVFISSFKDNQQIFNAPLALPDQWTLEKYLEAQQRVNLVKAMGVSFAITLSSIVISLFFGFLAAYAISRLKNPFSSLVETIFSTGFLIPAFAILVPVFLMAAKTRLLYNPLYLVLFYAAVRLSLTVVLLSSTMREIPLELEEAAICDGANISQVLYHVILPLSRSGIATVVILNFIEIWNEYLFALILLNQQNQTLQIVLPLLRGERVYDYGIIAAGLIIAMVPIVAIFTIFQERIMMGLYAGGVKG